jgi:glycosyltransferase 2 family protein
MLPRPSSPVVASAGSSLKERILKGSGPRIVTSLLIAVGFVWLLARGGFPLLPERSALARIPAWSVLTFLGLNLASMLLRTWRWVYLLRPIAPRIDSLRVLGIGLVGFGAIFFAPLRMGEIVRPFLVSQDGKVSFMQAAGTIFAERVIDGVVLTLAASASLLLASTVSPLPTRLGDLPLPLATVPAAVFTATAAFCALFVAMTAFYVARERARRFTRWLLGKVSVRAADFAASTLERLAEGLSFLPSRVNVLSFVASTIVAWFLAFLAQWLLLGASGLPATLTQACAMIGILGVGVVVPAGPGLFGAFQIASFSALALFFPLDAVRSEGAALVFVTYVSYVALSTLQTLLGVVIMAKATPSGGPR